MTKNQIKKKAKRKTSKKPPKKPGKATTGRPTKYGPEILEKAMDYLHNFESYGDAMPCNAGLSLELDIVPSTLYEWGNDPKKKEFSDILEKIKTKQERVLLSGSLFGDLNANISKLVLGKHGYSEKTENENTEKIVFTGMIKIPPKG